jgi:hypothetical protein
MGTRGFITFVNGGVEKTTYNQFDSYPSCLGLSVLRNVRELLGVELPLAEAAYEPALAELRHVVEGLRVVSQEHTPVTATDIDAYALWTDTYVDTRDENGDRRTTPSWYQLLRGTQGDINEILSAGCMLDASEFPADSLFAEWGYVIDLDDEDLEVYEGFQQEAHDVGRFAKRKRAREAYAPVKRIASWPLNELPTDGEFLAATTGRTLDAEDD